MNKRKVILEAIASLLILLFLYAGVSKILNFDRFIGEMNNQPFPNSWTPFLVWTIPSLEIAIALALMIESTRIDHRYYPSTKEILTSIIINEKTFV